MILIVIMVVGGESNAMKDIHVSHASLQTRPAHLKSLGNALSLTRQSKGILQAIGEMLTCNPW